MAGKKTKTLASVLFDEGYVLRDKEKGVMLGNLMRTDGRQVTAGDVRAAQSTADNWSRRKKA
jgi:hypothetical protein